MSRVNFSSIYKEILPLIKTAFLKGNIIFIPTRMYNMQVNITK